MTGWRARFPVALLPALAAATAVFGRAVTFPFVNWDDPTHFLRNPLAQHPLAQGWNGLFWTREIGYPAPVLQLSFALDMALFGTHAGYWHAENVLLHLANVSLLFALARRLGLSKAEAGASAAIFAVHPLVVEPVCWVTGRKDVLGVAMVLAACLVAAGPATGRPRPGRWIAANVLGMLAVLVLPRLVIAAAFVAIVAWSVRPGRGIARPAAAMSPSLAFGATVIALGIPQLRTLQAMPPSRSFSTIVQEMAGAWALQLGHLLWPNDFLAYYHRVPGDPSVSAMIVAALVALVVAWLAWTRNDARSPERIGIALAVVAYSPVSCVLSIYRWTADSYMYLPIAALSISVVPAVVRRWPANLRIFGQAASGVLLAITAVFAFAYTFRWRSSTALWAGSVERYPNEPAALEHEALALEWDGRKAEANALFIRLSRRFPDWADTFDDEVKAYEATGNEAAAREVLVRGLRAGQAACLRMFWLRVIDVPGYARSFDRDAVSTAFDRGWEAMKVGLRKDPAGLLTAAAALRSVGLVDDAGIIEEHVRTMRRSG